MIAYVLLRVLEIPSKTASEHVSNICTGKKFPLKLSGNFRKDDNKFSANKNNETAA